MQVQGYVYEALNCNKSRRFVAFCHQNDHTYFVFGSATKPSAMTRLRKLIASHGLTVKDWVDMEQPNQNGLNKQQLANILTGLAAGNFD